MEPMFPSFNLKELEEKSIKLIRLSSSLGSGLSEITTGQIAELVRVMNSYYSNLIEGNKTTPIEIEKAFEERTAGSKDIDAKKLEHIAHVKVQKMIDEILNSDREYNICTPEFICLIHREFYKNLPAEFRMVKNTSGKETEVIPGEFRNENVFVGKHIPPDFRSIGSFLERFCEVYNPQKLGSTQKIIAAAASHHRLSWIHPFLDGNGRTARLFTHAYLIKAGVNTRDLWSISRGFARDISNYYAHLENADIPRKNDLDGRGNLSDKGLYNFCEYFLDTAVDQVTYMGGLYDFENIYNRIKHFISIEGNIKNEAFYILKETFITGELKRGEALKITGLPERSARRILKDLQDRKLLVSNTPKSPVKMAFPVSAVQYYFPNLYPQGVYNS
jgi:Fic family protein